MVDKELPAGARSNYLSWNKGEGLWSTVGFYGLYQM